MQGKRGVACFFFWALTKCRRAISATATSDIEASIKACALGKFVLPYALVWLRSCARTSVKGINAKRRQDSVPAEAVVVVGAIVADKNKNANQAIAIFILPNQITGEHRCFILLRQSILGSLLLLYVECELLFATTMGGRIEVPTFFRVVASWFVVFSPVKVHFTTVTRLRLNQQSGFVLVTSSTPQTVVECKKEHIQKLVCRVKTTVPGAY